ncbi:MAG: MogA/MoaB family molybdenum cofactor biosynthesis protein [Desulfobulbaceae bacterium]|nr:MogA/MoaB family molybdenum cofactor biosynthesis protein [Desulfobulbaceae bacterium]
MEDQSGLYTFSVLTLSDKGSRGERDDTSGRMLCDLLQSLGYVLREYVILPDTHEEIVRCLRNWTEDKPVDLVLTTGGTGVAPTDVTPEATLEVVERLVPGIAEAMRQASLLKTPNAILSRGVAGIRGQTLIINLPGSEKAARENIEAVLPALPHGLYKLKGGAADCGVPPESVTRSE